MMATVFATMLLAFVSGWRGRARWSLLFLFASMSLGCGLFLYEVYSPEYGFRMPWIQTLDHGPAAGALRRSS